MNLLLAVAFVALVGAQDSTIYLPGNGVSLPQVVKEVKAEYTEEAKQNRIEGKVGLDVVVLADGAVGDVKVAQSLDSIYGLDANAVTAMRQWQFKPGMKDGKPGRRPHPRPDGLHAEMKPRDPRRSDDHAAR